MQEIKKMKSLSEIFYLNGAESQIIFNGRSHKLIEYAYWHATATKVVFEGSPEIIAASGGVCQALSAPTVFEWQRKIYGQNEELFLKTEISISNIKDPSSKYFQFLGIAELNGSFETISLQYIPSVTEEILFFDTEDGDLSQILTANFLYFAIAMSSANKVIVASDTTPSAVNGTQPSHPTFELTPMA